MALTPIKTARAECGTMAGDVLAESVAWLRGAVEQEQDGARRLAMEELLAVAPNLSQ